MRGLFVLPFMVAICNAAITLQPRGTIFLPSSVSDGVPVFNYNTNAATCGALDWRRDHYYVGGGSMISIYNIMDINNPQRLFRTELISGVIADIEVCGGFVAVAKDNAQSPPDGQVVIYRRYDSTFNVFEKVQEISVGTNPRDLDFTSDCQTIVVAVEGTLNSYGGSVSDPEGLVSVISWETNDLSAPYTLRLADFTRFNSRAEEYVNKGVRWVYRGEGSGVVNTFSQDLEPESVQIDDAEQNVYVVLQENNAIAVMDLENVTIKEIYPLGTKDFSHDNCDLSDRDGGIKLSPWPVRAFYQPSRISKTTVNDVTYLVVVNEGSERQYAPPNYPFTWRESKTGKELVSEGLLSPAVSGTVRSMLDDDAQLGRARFSTIDGIDPNNSGILDLHIYGGRSYSYYHPGNLSLAFESGSALETAISQANPNVFNADPTQEDMKPSESFDIRSPFMGPEPDAAATIKIGTYDVLFVGAGRPGQIVTYSVPDDGPFVPRLESVTYEGGDGASWKQLHADRDSKNVGIEALHVIPANESPTLQPLLVVIGRISGTVAFYQIRVTADSTWDKLVQIGQTMSTKLRNIGGAMSPTSVDDDTAESVAIAAICVASLALLVGAAILVVNVKHKAQMRRNKAYENSLPNQMT